MIYYRGLRSLYTWGNTNVSEDDKLPRNDVIMIQHQTLCSAVHDEQSFYTILNNACGYLYCDV